MSYKCILNKLRGFYYKSAIKLICNEILERVGHEVEHKLNMTKENLLLFTSC